MRKYRIIYVLVLILSVVLLFTNCSLKKDSAETKSTEIKRSFTGRFEPESCEAVTNSLKSDLSISNLIELEIEDISVHYGFSSAYLDDFSAYSSKTDGCADEIAVFKINKDNERQTAIDALMEKTKLKSQSYKDLNSKEYAKFGANAVSLHGNYIVVLICSSPDSAYNLLNEYYVWN